MVQPDDLIAYGMIPEFVGRLPCVTTLGPLDEGSLVRILTEPKNALVRQYRRFFEMEDAEMEFTDGALQAIAHKAMGLDTGARALRSVVEDLMLDLMYELPEVDTAGKRYVITEDAVDSPENLTLLSALVEKKETA